MRKLIYFTILSLDGFIETPDANLDWAPIDEELHTFFNAMGREIGTDLYGRRMYELMQAFWPTADTTSDLPYIVEYSKIWKQIPKLVFSSTLAQVEGNATLIREDPVSTVKRLKDENGNTGDIEVGGAKLAAALIQAGLVDDYRLFVVPIILGAGTPMLPSLKKAVNLKLVETHTFHSGVVYLHYEC